MFNKIWLLTEDAAKTVKQQRKNVFLFVNSIIWLMLSSLAAVIVSTVFGQTASAGTALLWGIFGAWMIGFYGGIVYLYRTEESGRRS